MGRLIEVGARLVLFRKGTLEKAVAVFLFFFLFEEKKAGKSGPKAENRASQMTRKRLMVAYLHVLANHFTDQWPVQVQHLILNGFSHGG